MAANCGSQNYRLFVKRQGTCGGDFCVTVRDGKLVLTRPNSCDPNQIWHKDSSSKHGFMLINKAVDKPIKYGAQGDPLHLVNKSTCHDKLTLWNESGDITCGYEFIKTNCNHRMVMDAWNGQIYDGTIVSIYPGKDNDQENQLWTLVRCAH